MLNDVIRIPCIVRTNSLFVHTNNRTPHVLGAQTTRTVDIVAKSCLTKHAGNGMAHFQLRLERVSEQTENKRQRANGDVIDVDHVKNNKSTM